LALLGSSGRSGRWGRRGKRSGHVRVRVVLLLTTVAAAAGTVPIAVGIVCGGGGSDVVGRWGARGGHHCRRSWRRVFSVERWVAKPLTVHAVIVSAILPARVGTGVVIWVAGTAHSRVASVRRTAGPWVVSAVLSPSTVTNSLIIAGRQRVHEIGTHFTPVI